MKNFFWILLIVGYIVAGVSTVGSVGYGLYLWGSEGLAFNVSAWSAFVLWLKLFFSGIAMVLVGIWGSDL